MPLGAFVWRCSPLLDLDSPPLFSCLFIPRMLDVACGTRIIRALSTLSHQVSVYPCPPSSLPLYSLFTPSLLPLSSLFTPSSLPLYSLFPPSACCRPRRHSVRGSRPARRHAPLHPDPLQAAARRTPGEGGRPWSVKTKVKQWGSLPGALYPSYFTQTINPVILSVMVLLRCFSVRR